MAKSSRNEQSFPGRLRAGLGRFARSDQLVRAGLAVVVGAAAGVGAIAFREFIALVQTAFFGFGSERVYSLAAALPWWHLVLAPTVGGLAIGLFVAYVLPGRRPRGVADVIEASALRDGRMSLKTGLGAAFVSAASIGVGASVGREGPVVHLGASLGGWLAKRLHLSRSLSLTLLGCGIASGIAASFNTPLAGVIFALEVVIGHYALNTFAPVVIAAVTGTIISRVYFGDFPAFVIPEQVIVSFLEFPAFAGLGVLSGIVAIVFIRTTFLVEEGVARTGLPRWLRPALGGLAVGLIALSFPQVLGVGYEATDAALKAMFPFWLLVALLVAKLVATAVSLGCGFGGGVFSPSLVMGAMLGGASGAVFTAIAPELSSGLGAYSLVGMGAVAGAVLGAPISTILIIFELTGDYALTVAVMLAVVIATVMTRQIVGHSFFTLQLERAGLSLEGGREARLFREQRVGGVMRDDYETIPVSAGMAEVRQRLLTAAYGVLYVVEDGDRLAGRVVLGDLREVAFDTSRDHEIGVADVVRPEAPVLAAGDSLEAARELMAASGKTQVAVVETTENMRLVGALHERDVITAHNRALLQARAEEKGEI
ncbi:MAG: chloride channel protein [Alphaproteobacteria bacterium]